MNMTRRAVRKSDPVLLTPDGDYLCAKKVNNMLRVLAAKAGLQPEGYTSHGLRMGHCIDLVKAGNPKWWIKKWGRWASNCWEATYAKLDFRELAALLKTPVLELGYLLPVE